jgi:hypothetical protein
MRATIIGLCLCAAGTPALADYASPWSLGASVGYDMPVGGSVLSSGNSNSLTLSTVNPSFVGTGVIQLRGTDYQDAYDPALRATIEVRYAVSEYTELFGAFSYSRADGKALDVGCIAVAAACTSTLRGQFSDFKQMGLEIGYRQWLDIALLGDAVRPYFSVRGGVVKTDAIHAFLQTPTGPVGHWRLYKDTYAYTLGADVGATIGISQNAEIGGEVGIRYQTALKEIDTEFGSFGLSDINGSSERLSVPVSIRLNAVF